MSRFIYCLVICLLMSPVLMAAESGKDELGEGMVNPGYHEKPDWFKESFLDIREDVQEAIDAKKRVLLYFYQDGCPYCEKLLRVNFTNREISQKTQSNFDVIAINMWGDREVTDFDGQPTTEKAFSTALGVQYTPTLLFLNESGDVVVRINGYFAPHKFNLVLDYVSGHHEKKEKFRSFYAKHRPKAASGKLHQRPSYLPWPLKLADNRKSSYRPLLVLFEQAECLECDELHKEIFNREAVAHALTNVDVALVDTWSGQMLQTPQGDQMKAKDWAKELGIQYAPSLVFFDSEGDEVFRSEAYLKSFHIHGAIDYVITGAYKHQPEFQRYLQHRTDQLHAEGFEVDLMK